MADKIKIEWLVKKAEDWKVASIIKEDGAKLTEVSINRTSKKGEPFPNFDGLMPGQEVVGTLWQSSGGKWYLFPPQPEKPAGGANYANKTASITKAMEKKEASIEKFQSSKEESIKLMSAQRDAVLIVTTIGTTDLTEDAIKHEIIKWRNWFLLSKEFNDIPPFE